MPSQRDPQKSKPPVNPDVESGRSGSAKTARRSGTPQPKSGKILSEVRDSLTAGRSVSGSDEPFHLFDAIPNPCAIELEYICNETGQTTNMFSPSTWEGKRLRDLFRYAIKSNPSDKFPSPEAISSQYSTLQTAFRDAIITAAKLGVKKYASFTYEHASRSLKLLCKDLNQLFDCEKFWRFACRYDRYYTDDDPAKDSSVPNGGVRLDERVEWLIVTLQTLFKLFELGFVQLLSPKEGFEIFEEMPDDHHCKSFPGISKAIRAYIMQYWSDDMHFWLAECVFRYVSLREAGGEADCAFDELRSVGCVPGQSQADLPDSLIIPNGLTEDDQGGKKLTFEDIKERFDYFPISAAMWLQMKQTPLIKFCSYIWGSRRNRALSGLRAHVPTEYEYVLPLFTMYVVWAVPCLVSDLSPVFPCRLEYGVDQLQMEALGTKMFSPKIWTYTSQVLKLVALFPAWKRRGVESAAEIPMAPIIAQTTKDDQEEAE